MRIRRPSPATPPPVSLRKPQPGEVAHAGNVRGSRSSLKTRDPGDKGHGMEKSGNTRGARTALRTKSAPAEAGTKVTPKAGNTRGARTALRTKRDVFDARPPGPGDRDYGLGNVRGRRPDVLRAQGLAGDGFEPGVRRSGGSSLDGRLPTSVGPARRNSDGDGFGPTPATDDGKSRIQAGNQLTSRGPIKKVGNNGINGAG